MPPHHHHHGHNYSDDWWEDLPEKAKRAAKVLGYDQETWDADSPIPYDSKSFPECSYQEKHAAMYLHMSPIDKKLDLWWDDVDEETKKFAQVLGWDHHKWDDDWEIEDLPCEHWNWNDMTDEQQEAGRHFGYGRGTWDYVEDEEEDFEMSGGHGSPPPNQPVVAKPSVTAPPAEAAPTHTEAAPAHTEAAPTHTEAAATSQPLPTTTTASSTGGMIQLSAVFGGDGGGEFDQLEHTAVHAITLYTDGHRINGIKMVYNDGTLMSGSDLGDAHDFKLQDNEHITAVKVRSNRCIQCLTFTTNKGKTLGPCGGRGWLIGGQDKPGKEANAIAPARHKLVGIKGRSGKAIDQLVFRWGPL